MTKYEKSSTTALHTETSYRHVNMVSTANPSDPMPCALASVLLPESRMHGCHMQKTLFPGPAPHVRGVMIVLLLFLLLDRAGRSTSTTLVLVHVPHACSPRGTLFTQRARRTFRDFSPSTRTHRLHRCIIRTPHSCDPPATSYHTQYVTCLVQLPESSSSP